MSTNDRIAEEFWPLFCRVLGKPVTPARYTPEQIPEWDSLRHVELIFELEERFRIEVPQDRIAALYEDTDALLGFLRERAAATE